MESVLRRELPVVGCEVCRQRRGCSRDMRQEGECD
jgi:hypothetical protein